MPNQTPAQRLQECRDEKDQLKNRLDLHEGLKEELEATREKLARAQLQLEQDVSLTDSERRRYKEQLDEAIAARDAWTRRAMKVENELASYRSIILELRSFVAGKECILPQIKHILGGTQ